MRNLTLAEAVLKKCYAYGVREFCICAGARNSPFVVLLDKAKNSTDIQVYSFFEERSAGFFALGRIESLIQENSSFNSVAVITTSGTAAAELLPAVIEAHYTARPLIVITADRPRRYRGTGAPQAIEQVGIYSCYVEKNFDFVDASELNDQIMWSGSAPQHLNVCFDEPLIDGQVFSIDFNTSEVSAQKTIATTANKIRNESAQENTEPSYFAESLIILGSIPSFAQDKVFEFLTCINLPIYAESLSNLRGRLTQDPRTKNRLLRGGDLVVNLGAAQNLFQSVVRIGGVPTLRFWRDLEEKYLNIPVLSISETKFTGLARSSQHIQGYEYLDKIQRYFERQEPSNFEKLIMLDKKYEEFLNCAINNFPKSEPTLIRELSKIISEHSIYLGNSMPIREWDLVSKFAMTSKRIFGNRGANGIDGQISSFLGWAYFGEKTDVDVQNENWAIIGDLTALYDLSALWASQYLDSVKCRLVIVNNGGGHIFKNMFRHEAFLNRHQIHFNKWAEMWNWSYEKWIEIPNSNYLNQLPNRVIIELVPDEVETEKFWSAYSGECK